MRSPSPIHGTEIPERIARCLEIRTIEERLRSVYSQLDGCRGNDRALLRATSQNVGDVIGALPWDAQRSDGREAKIITCCWATMMDVVDQTHSEGILLRTTVMTQQSEIVELRAADQRRQTVISELLKADYRRQRQLVETLKIVKSSRLR
ncbi:hypothetical protein Tco_0625875 [Tanacetum coccineum]|uniref:Uncharacterized protein n=1 Tax=Tanacetum coccineum TaxID=301880 RepID=A0ABQ4WI01_9ASTR